MTAPKGGHSYQPMFKPHRKTKERVYHTEETKRRALEAWRANPTRPKAAIAREFGISPGTFNMWTHETGSQTQAEPTAQQPDTSSLRSFNVGDRVRVVETPANVMLQRSRVGHAGVIEFINHDENDNNPFLVRFDDGIELWVMEADLELIKGFQNELLSQAVLELRRIANALERRAC